MNQLIFCTGCEEKVMARLTTGEEIYEHRPDLFDRPYWICDVCRNYVGCHYKSENRIRPMGSIPTKEISKYRTSIHALLDPLWREGLIKRTRLYSVISSRLGYSFHAGQINSVEEAQQILRIVEEVDQSLRLLGT